MSDIYDDDFEDDDFDDDFEDEYDFGECGLLPDEVGGGCTMAGTEYCDFYCKLRQFMEQGEEER